MKFNTLLATAVLALTIAAPAANAATYNFSWSADPAKDAAITAADDATLTAIGSFDLNVGFGSSFFNTDFSNVSILVSGSSITDFTTTAFINGFGTVATDGSISFSDFRIFESLTSPRKFGCDFFGCAGREIRANSRALSVTKYREPSDALASLNAATSLAMAPIPLPTGGLLLLSGLAGVAALKRRKKYSA